MYGNMSVFLLMNDIPVRDWAGYVDHWDDFSRLDEIQRFKQQLFGPLLVHISLRDSHYYWGVPDDTISQYYGGIDPYNNRTWGSHSPVPYHFTLQWGQKLKTVPAPGDPPPPQLITVKGNRYYCFRSDKKHRETLLYGLSSFNTEEYHPVLIDKTPDDTAASPVCSSWVEQESYISLTVSQAHCVKNARYLETMTPTEASTIIQEQPIDDRPLYVVQSYYGVSSWNEQTPHVTSITWPDPPTAMDVINVAKNYVLMPALAALTGFATGGPVGALVSGTGTILGQAIADSVENRERKRLKDAVKMELLATPQVVHPVQPPTPVPGVVQSD